MDAPSRPKNEPEFRAATEPHRRELLAHCYRITGSVADAEDALQEAWVRAWRSLDAFEGRSSFRRWLYAIATRTSLDLVSARRGRTLPLFSVDAGDPAAPLPSGAPAEATWLEPFPDDLLETTVVDPSPGPDVRFDNRESIGLAFVAVLQALPPRQRGALILRDVVGYSATETAEILEMSVPATNSALQRARDTLDKRVDKRVDKPGKPVADDTERGLLERLMRAFEAKDADAIARLLHDDAAYSMPPMPLWFDGRDAIRAFLADVLFRAPFMHALRVIPCRANGAPAMASYAASPDDPAVFVPASLTVLSVDGDRVRAMHAFVGPFDAALFGLPAGL